MKLSRRAVNVSLMSAAFAALSPSGSGRTSKMQFGTPLAEARYRDVDFAQCPQQAQLEQTHDILMNLDENSLLRQYRISAALPAPGSDLGGWYSSAAFGPETFGQWISALSRYYAISGHKETRDKVHRLLDLFSQTIEPAGKVFVGVPGVTQQPAYHYDKLVCGLVDAHQHAEYPAALSMLGRITEAVVPHLPGRVPEDGAHESYTIPENQFIAWERSGDEKYLKMARQYLYDAFFDPLARGENVLGGRHAYSHVNSLCSAAKAYLVFGEEKYLQAAINGFTFVEEQSFATGGWGPDETFLPYSDPMSGERRYSPGVTSLADSITRSVSHFETPCGGYAHFKLTRYLLRITKDPRYGDSMERVMYNTVLGALPLNGYGNAFYQSNYHSHANKAYFDGYKHSMEDEWPCCSGTLPQVAADYRINTYFLDHEGVYVNLFIPSTVRWEHNGTQISLEQSGAFPLDDTITFQIVASRPVQCTVRLRIPRWARAPDIRLNGARLSLPVRPGTFAEIRRKWSSGDRIELKLPARLELLSIDATQPDTVAVVFGPLVLFALTEDTPIVTRAQLLAAEPVHPGGAEWLAETGNGALRLLPFWAINDEMYFTYLSVRT
jgi:uncharacterized protein